MAFNIGNIGRRDTRCRVIKPTVIYDGDGIEQITTAVTFAFWGDVKEVKDEGEISAYKRLEARTIQIEVDTRSAASVSILDTLTTDQSDDTYEVVDKYDADWKYTSMIICKHKQ